MHRDRDREKLFGRRVAMLAGGKLLLLSALVGRMYYLQVVESERYKTLADENRISLRLLPPPRGRIVDRFGVPMAVNRKNYQVVVVPADTGDVEATLDRLGKIIPIGENERRRIRREVRRKRWFVPVTVRANLNWREVARIEVNAPDLPGVMIDVGQIRYYPHGEETAPVLGYVAAVSEGETTADPMLQLPGFRIGKAGVEKTYDLVLRGSGGSSQVEVNALGRVIKELRRREGQPGAEIKLTVDLKLQRLVSERLKDKSAAMVVLDVHSGAVLAMASTPSFDPNAFNKGLSAEQWKVLSSNPRAPLINKAIGGQYPPGSTLKMAVALAGLAKGSITPASKFFCSGFLKLGNTKFHCWKKGGHGTLDLEGGIVQSCDVYFYELAKRVGIERIAAMAHRLGLGYLSGLDLPGERQGLVPSREWKLAEVGIPWQMGETLLIGIGQGYVLATPLQLAVMTAQLANGGNKVVPHLTQDMVTPDGVVPRPPREPSSLGISPAHLKIIHRALAGAVNSPLGTGYRSRIGEAGYEMGGKTGTVQVKRISKAEREHGVRKNNELPWAQRDHAMFVGFAPVEAPRYAVTVVVEHGGVGASVAAPIGRDILLAAQRCGLQAGPPMGPLTGCSVEDVSAARQGRG